ncbi:MAG: RsmB/NOP family class I SAM-dependent RNA methyltransferase, partial [Nitratireductor sp.]
AHVTAVDGSANRLRRLAVNLDRLGLSAEIVRADLVTWRPARLFDAVLLDAPCSATGTLRRHPDIAWTKTPDDIARLAAAQRRLLDAASALVRPGGRLVFSNCSLDPEEGEQLIAGFLDERHDFCREPVGPAEFDGLEGLVDARGDLRTTPADWPAEDPRWSGMDGFFATRLRRSG